MQKAYETFLHFCGVNSQFQVVFIASCLCIHSFDVDYFGEEIQYILVYVEGQMHQLLFFTSFQDLCCLHATCSSTPSPFALRCCKSTSPLTLPATSKITTPAYPTCKDSPDSQAALFYLFSRTQKPLKTCLCQPKLVRGLAQCICDHF